MNVQVREGKKLTECFKVRETKVFLDKLRDVIRRHTVISSKPYFFEDEITKFAKTRNDSIPRFSLRLKRPNKYKQKQMYARLKQNVEVRKAEADVEVGKQKQKQMCVKRKSM
jgi:hypothetical protein